ncbi:sensor histidine kinase [Albibacterium bauzanense]|uniref:histidine kinase n=1 Tax=Albibacterium bauzanense TaxID=653929 RepID=A0A4R1M6K7_9SPHI|nr:HAMP domain-containing sensor histidine kinase [Albibacterium bauzanense]TCK85379.1 signal transduction histidine kinase [Albibacterium bauzanense]
MKLLTYSTKRYLVFSVLLVVLSIPIFYIVLEKLFIRAVDDSLKHQAILLPEYTKHIKSEADIELWKNLDWDIEVNPANGIAIKQRPYTIIEHSKGAKESIQFRALEKDVRLLDRDYVITFKSSLIEKEDLVKAVLGLQIALLSFLFLGYLWINQYISKKIWKPFQGILNYLKTFELDKGIINSNTDLVIDEFRELNYSVNGLVSRVNTAYSSQKEFTENASHELQTPLAIMRVKLELLLQEEHLSESQSKLIDEINGVLTGMEQMNTSLLLLTKMDNQQYPLNEEFSASELIKEIIEELDFFIEVSQHHISYVEETNTSLLGNHQLFKQVVTNLLLNAIKYSAPGSEIRIILSSKSIEIINPGEEMPFKKEKLFERFSKKQGNSKGNSLGLAISFRIIKLHGMKLAYVYQEAHHHFAIYF